MREIKIFGRGGQGAVTAAQILATADPALRQRLQRHKVAMAEKVIEKNRSLGRSVSRSHG